MSSDQNGQTLVELIVVVAVSVIVVGALVFATIASLRNASFSKNQAQATKLAQEGLERVRAGRDRNQCINNLDTNVKSWNGGSSNTNCLGVGAFWDYTVYNGCGSGVQGTACYFNVLSNGVLNYVPSSSTFPTSDAEEIGQFRRAIIINDVSGTSNVQKTVTSVVRWTDFSGPHESRLITILRRI